MSTGLIAYKVKSLKLHDGNRLLTVIGIKNYYTGRDSHRIFKINAYIYDTKKQSFKKIKFKYAALDLPVAVNSDNKLIYTAYKTLFADENIHLYDIKTQKLQRTHLCNFSKNCKLKPNNLKFLKQIAPDKALVMSQNNNLKMQYGESPKLKNKEYMYFFDLKNLTFKQLPDFAIPLKYYPQESDILTLKNGNFVIFVRSFDGNKMNYDHIEIYDAKKNKFIAEKNTNFIEDNIFTIDLENGNILFINQNSSCYFDVTKNKFEKTTSVESGKNKIVIYQLENKLKEIFNIYLYPEYTGKIKYIKIAPQKYLVTCGDLCMDYIYYKKSNGVCKKSLIYDYQSNTVKQGPDFLYKHKRTSVIPLDAKNTALGGIIPDSNGDNYYPTNRNLQVITVIP
ncbi:MAG: hypothetical protein KH321_01340 [Clostridium sp.]|nr:hypothetical protein [Clostridium sp.]